MKNDTDKKSQIQILVHKKVTRLLANQKGFLHEGGPRFISRKSEKVPQCEDAIMILLGVDIRFVQSNQDSLSYLNSLRLFSRAKIFVFSVRSARVRVRLCSSPMCCRGAPDCRWQVRRREREVVV